MEELEKTKILIVHDRPENILSLETILENEPCEVVKALSGNEALAQVVANDFAMVLFDVQMPGMEGFETAELMRSNKKTEHVPIIFVTAISKEKKHIFKGYQSGAVDYIFKPVNPDMLKNKIRLLMDLHRQKQLIENSNIQWEEANKKILEQQKAVIEEERLKLLLQMAGATANELDQPILNLLEIIQMMESNMGDSDKLTQHMAKLTEIGKKIAAIIKKAQIVHHDTQTVFPDGESRFNIDHDLSILHVEYEEVFFKVVKNILEEQGAANISNAVSIKDAKEQLEKNKYNIILLEYNLPDGNAIDLLTHIKDLNINVPAVMITGHGNEKIAVKSLQAGCSEYLSKRDFSRDALFSAIRNALEKFRVKREFDTAIAEMARMSTRDGLTGLYNHRHMIKILDNEFYRAKRYGTDLSCLLLDLDFFKDVNDTFGHQFGDFVLKEFSRRIERTSRDSDYCFRYGGEEFLMLLPHIDIEGALQKAESIRTEIDTQPYDDGTDKTTVTVSIGVASFKECIPAKPEDLLGFADKAAYQAKTEGRNRIVAYRKKSAPQDKGKVVPGGKDLNYLKNHLASILEKTKQSSISSLELLIRETREPGLKERSQQFVKYLTLIGEKLCLPRPLIETFRRVALLHNCFSIMLEKLVTSAGDTLTEEEDIIKHHPYMVNDLAEMFDFFSDERSVLLHHHENYDGTGYPEGLKGDQIPLGARMFRVVDALVAMTSKRTYKKILSMEEAIAELSDNAGRQFDPSLVSMLLDIIKLHETKRSSDDSPAQAKDKAESEIAELGKKGILGQPPSRP